MKRRSFLKLIGATIMVPVLPVPKPELICLGSFGQVGKKKIKIGGKSLLSKIEAGIHAVSGINKEMSGHPACVAYFPAKEPGPIYEQLKSTRGMTEPVGPTYEGEVGIIEEIRWRK